MITERESPSHYEQTRVHEFESIEEKERERAIIYYL